MYSKIFAYAFIAFGSIFFSVFLFVFYAFEVNNTYFSPLSAFGAAVIGLLTIFVGILELAGKRKQTIQKIQQYIGVEKEDKQSNCLTILNYLIHLKLIIRKNTNFLKSFLL